MFFAPKNEARSDWLTEIKKIWGSFLKEMGNILPVFPWIIETLVNRRKSKGLCVCVIAVRSSNFTLVF